MKNKRKIQCKKCKLKNFISVLHSSVFRIIVKATSSIQVPYKFHQYQNEFYTQK